MSKWRYKRLLDKQKQYRYFIDNPNCQICGKLGAQTHEIVFRSQGGKCEYNNLITLCYECHLRCHNLGEKPYLKRSDLWRAKGLSVEVMEKKLRDFRKNK